MPRPFVILYAVILTFSPAVAGLILSPHASAQQAGYQITASSDLTEGGRTIGREFQCACVSANDRIKVYRTTGSTPVLSDITQDSNYDGTLWLFDVGDRGHDQIAVEFHRVDDQLVADVYQDQDGDGAVSTRRVGDTVQVVEPGFWSVRVVARDGYWQSNGRIAPNFDLFVDDRFEATFGSGRYESFMKNDGVVDVVVRVRGPRPNDPRSYDWRNVYSPVPASSGVLRTTLMVREQGLEPSFPAAFPWYLLGPATGIVKLPGESFPPIQVNWETGKIAFLGEFVASRGSDVNWFDYSLVRIEPNATTDPDFESPFAFYDLADDHDSLPELQVRVDRMNPDDPYNSAPAAWRGRPYQQIRYSWDQENTKNWTYKVSLLGQQSIDSVVSFPDFTMKTIPYELLPQWVTEHSWNIATFVAAEGPLWTSEGIYDWDAGDLRDGYFAGVSDLPDAFGKTIDIARRGEYALNLDDQPWLYFSPIDHQLHLAKAEAGVWNIDGQQELRYLNSSGGDIFDGWQLWNEGQLEAQLYRVPGGLLFSDESGTYFTRVDIPDDLFRALPPTNHDEWKQLGQQLAASKRDIPPGDLRAMFDQFGGDVIQISTSQMTDFTRTNDGVRFVAQIGNEVTRATVSALASQDLSEGLYAFSMDANDWQVAPATSAPPHLEISTDAQGALRTVPVVVQVTNPGSFQLGDATLTLQAIAADGRTGTSVGSYSVKLSSNDSQSFSFPWAPGRGGAWTLNATLTRAGADPRTGEHAVLQEQTEVVEIPAISALSLASADHLGWAGTVTGRLALVLGLVVVSGVAAAAGLWRGLHLR